MSDVQLSFTIYLTDQDRVRQLQAQYPNGVIRGPQPAAVEFSAPYQTRDLAFSAPCTRTAWHPKESSGKFLYDRAVFRIAKGGFFGWLVGANDRFIWTGHFEYAAAAATPPAEGSTNAGAGPVEIEALPPRKWIDGFELRSIDSGSNIQGEGGTGSGRPGRAYSRLPDGIGVGMRSDGQAITHTSTEFNGVSAVSHGWERMYLRLVRAPSTPVEFWRLKSTGGGTGAEGLHLKISPSGQISIWSVDNSSVETLTASTPALTIGARTKIDITYNYYVATTLGTDELYCHCVLWINGRQVTQGGGKVRTPFSTVLKCGSSVIMSGSSHDLELDIDDWIGANSPVRFQPRTAILGLDIVAGVTSAAYVDYVVGGVTRTYRAIANSGPSYGGVVYPPNAATWVQVIGPVDFFSGSHVRLVRPTAFGSGHETAKWDTGSADVRTIERRVIEGRSGLTAITSGTAAALLEVDTDAKERGQGIAALVVSAVAAHVAGTYSVGASIAGGAFEDFSQSSSGGVLWHPGLANVDGVIKAPRTVAPLKLRYQKGATASGVPVSALMAAVEYIGVFDACDIGTDPSEVSPADPPTAPRVASIHNSSYPDSPWAAQTQSPPFAGVEVFAGTYAGNSAWNAISFPVPIHFLWTRPLTTGVSPGGRWWTSMLTPHASIEGSPNQDANLIHRENTSYVSPGGATDSEEQYKIQAGGAGNAFNNNGKSYQYIAISDPGGRFLLNGAFWHGANAIDNGATHALADAQFLPTFLLAWLEFLTATGDTATCRLWGKGPGNLVNEASRMDTSATTTALALTAGTITAYSAFNNLGMQAAYAAFRALESPTLLNVDGTTPIVFQIGSYIGSGVNPRVVNLTPPTGSRRPLFAIVLPDNGAAYFRDPSHATGQSQPVNSSTIATANGITAGGVDSITVGSGLNTAGVDYSVLVVVGGTVAGTDGWSQNGTFILADPAMPGGTQYTAAPFGNTDSLTDDEVQALDDTVDTSGDTLPTVSDDFGDTSCEPYSTRVVNTALSRVGVNNPIVGLLTEQSAAAAAVRLVYDDALDGTLMEYPWPFATRYATLTLVAGTATSPVNADWLYSYRVPANCVFPRRLAIARGEAVNPQAPPFELSSDATGQLLHTNQVSAVLEYTARPTCPARIGDAIFRSAWAWRMANEVAPALTRMADRAAHCWEMYLGTLAKAETFHKLGKPGLLAAVDVTDPDANSLTEKLRAINVALLRIGAQTIATFNEQSREAVAALLVYEDELRSTLRDSPWPFTTRYATLVLVDGDTTTPAVPDWVYSYRMPNDALFARRIVKDIVETGIGRRFDAAPDPYITASDATGLLIFTNKEDAVLEYTIRPGDVLLVSDAMFRDAFSWRLAAALAPSLATPEPAVEEQRGRAAAKEVTDPRPSEGGRVRLQQMRLERAKWAWAMYERALSLAEASSANEEQREADGDASWISGRA